MPEPDPQQLLTALSTEHFTLQGARSQTMSESSEIAGSRANLFLLSGHDDGVGAQVEPLNPSSVTAAERSRG